MSRNNVLPVIVIAFLFFVPASRVSAQKANADPAKEHEQKVKDMVAFLEYVLNTLGSGTTSARDKDVLITESYTKIFRDAKVQVEDDLVDNRNVITNKDVQAYLKDVDFFFNDVKFELRIDKIQGNLTPDERLFYKVSVTRNLKGTTMDGKLVNATIPRFIEINYDPKDQDLKIVSIYTKEFDERVALLNWWNQLSYEWQSIFKKKLNILTDSLQLTDIRNITSIERLDISNNRYIRSIEPVSQLLSLRVLDMSNTDLADISPVRNLTELVELNISHTIIEDISPLRYSDKLKIFNLSHTPVNDITVFQKMPALERLEMASVGLKDFTPLGDLADLKYLNLEGSNIMNLTPLSMLTSLIELTLSKTQARDLSPIANLKKLTFLNIDVTILSDISALGNLESLQVLNMNNTRVSDLHPLRNCAQLEKVYCDNTPIKRDQANAFMLSRPDVLVIFDSQDLRDWWSVLPTVWKNVFQQALQIGPDPAKEELARITSLDSINLAGKIFVSDFEPLRRLQKLQVIIASQTAISGLSSLRELREIRHLDISDTQVSDFSDILHLTKLKVLYADKTKVEDIALLTGITSLEKLYVDQTAIHDIHAQGFLKKSPDCLIVYKTRHLERWWDEMPESWKGILQARIPLRSELKREDLHTLVELEVLRFSDVPVNDLSPLQEFVRLKELHFSGTAVTDLASLAEIKSLRKLSTTNSPIRKIDPLDQLVDMEDLDISNTPVTDLSPLAGLQSLKSLNCSGTKIKKLNPLSRLKGLESLDCSNTPVKKLDPVMRLSLKSLKCYNTRASKGQVEDFREINPDCAVVYYR